MSDATPGRREFRRVKKDPHTVKPGHYINEGQVDPTHRGPGSPPQPGTSGPPRPALRYPVTNKPKAARNRNKSGGVR